jgi:hypothetical protein
MGAGNPKNAGQAGSQNSLGQRIVARMEILAAIKGLELLKQPCKVVLYSDSQYVVDAIMKGWAARWKRQDCWLNNQERAKNFDLWQMETNSRVLLRIRLVLSEVSDGLPGRRSQAVHSTAAFALLTGTRPTVCAFMVIA